MFNSVYIAKGISDEKHKTKTGKKTRFRWTDGRTAKQTLQKLYAICRPTYIIQN